MARRFDDLDVLEPPPERSYPAARAVRFGGGMLRRSLLYRFVRKLVMMAAVAVLVLWLLFAYVAPKLPSWSDKISDRLDQLGTTTTTTTAAP